jgi:hypothetical protein
MKKLTWCVIAALIIVTLAAAVIGFAAKPASDAPATSILNDTDASTGQVYRIGSDSLGPYRNATNSVSSIIQGIGDWELDTKRSTVRRVRIDFGDPVVGSGANPPFQSAVVPLRFISKCASSPWSIFMPGMALGQRANCPLAISFDYNGVTYAVRANENYAGTEPVQWTCVDRSSTKCVGWTGVPSAVQIDGQSKIVMQLLKPATRPRETDQLLGRFYMSFRFDITTP